MADFQEMIQRVRVDDEEAVGELVADYEPQIRRVVRVRMLNPQLRQLIDSTDVCQSVLANFFVRVREGGFELDDPTQLKRLLFTMARNKVSDWVRKQTNQRRDMNRVVSIDRVPGNDLADQRDDDPANLYASKEQWSQVMAALSEKMRRVALARSSGDSWQEIADREGSSPDAIRVRFQRELARLAETLH